MFIDEARSEKERSTVASVPPEARPKVVASIFGQIRPAVATHILGGLIMCASSERTAPRRSIFVSEKSNQVATSAGRHIREYCGLRIGGVGDEVQDTT